MILICKGHELMLNIQAFEFLRMKLCHGVLVATITKKRKRTRWIFLERKKNKGMEDPYILAIPGGMVKADITISASEDLFNEFRMKDEDELRGYLLSYIELIKIEE